MNKLQYCNNCGNKGHHFHNCKYPITSIGIIVLRFNKDKNDYEFLTIRRKNSLGFVDFMRGKYNVYNKDYILNIINEMTNYEKEILKTYSFDDLWNYLWGNTVILKYRNEQKYSREKFNNLKNGISYNNSMYNLTDLVEQSTTTWNEEEWGFPKGRRNFQEKDIYTALREFSEETGISQYDISIIQNILPYEEVFTGSNLKSYKHKYYIGCINNYNQDLTRFQTTEVSKLEWKTYNECINSIRPYSYEKIDVLTKLYSSIKKYKLINID